MGKARDGSECYTRTNNAGGKYTTCEGEQKRNRKVQREISKLHERTRVKVTKDEFNEARAGLQQTLTRPSGEAAAPQVLIPQVRDERIDTKVRQLDGRPWKSGKGRAKNPHTWIAMGPDGRATSEALMKVVSDYESGVLSKTEVNTVIYRASQIILDEREAEGALAGLQADYEQDVDDIALQTTAALDRVFNFEVAEAPGVVGMTSTMSPLGQATFDALLGMGADVSRGISAAVEKSYQRRAKEVFENFKKDFGGREHYAHVQVGGYHDLNWDGYNLYKKDLFKRGKKVGTYENEAHLEEWRDYGYAQAFTQWDPLELSSNAKGLNLQI